MPEDIVKWAVLQKRESQSQPVRLGYSCLWVPPQELGISSVSCVFVSQNHSSHREAEEFDWEANLVLLSWS